MARQRKIVELDRDCWDRFLARLDSEPNLAGKEVGEKYARLHRRLVIYFEARELRAADEAADETLDRVMRRYCEGEQIIRLLAYAWKVAHFVHLEFKRQEEPLVEGDPPQGQPQRQGDNQEEMLACCEACLGRLPAEKRGLILSFHGGEGRASERRKALAAELGITLNALYIRVSRINDELEACITSCLQGGPDA